MVQIYGHFVLFGMSKKGNSIFELVLHTALSKIMSLGWLGEPVMYCRPTPEVGSTPNLAD
jgi:hypothetical protein